MSGLMTNHEWTRMDTNTEKLLLKEEVFQLVGCAVEVIDALGHGLNFKHRKLEWERIAL
jgi:hypothetical protein